MRTASLSVHGGTDVRKAHNRRDRSVTDYESHIDPNGLYEIWEDKSLSAVYAEEFGQAVLDYNKKTRGKKIGNNPQTVEEAGRAYLEHVIQERREMEAYNEQVAADNARIMAEWEASPEDERPEKPPLRHKKAAAAPEYELIMGVYIKTGEKLTVEQKREILLLQYEGFKKRNPGLVITGAYFHADEPEADVHLHLDYVPVGTGYKRGMERQNSLEQALKLSGYQSSGSMKQTAQIAFQSAERDNLQHIAEEMCPGLHIVYTQRGKDSRHKSTAEYKLEQQYEKIRAENERLQRQNEKLQKRVGGLMAPFKAIRGALDDDKAKAAAEIEQKRQERMEEEAKLESIRRERQEEEEALERVSAKVEAKERQNDAQRALKRDLGAQTKAETQQMEKIQDYYGRLAAGELGLDVREKGVITYLKATRKYEAVLKDARSYFKAERERNSGAFNRKADEIGRKIRQANKETDEEYS